MKLRNKKTGRIVNFRQIAFDEPKDDRENYRYSSLAEFNKEWEDVPAEPLIKDEKIRKAVRAWWETVPDVITDKRIIYKKNQDLAVGVYSIFCGAIYPETLEVGKMYTIDELCGVEDD